VLDRSEVPADLGSNPRVAELLEHFAPETLVRTLAQLDVPAGQKIVIRSIDATQEDVCFHHHDGPRDQFDVLQPIPPTPRRPPVFIHILELREPRDRG
jgi:hypothetical protein